MSGLFALPVTPDVTRGLAGYARAKSPTPGQARGDGGFGGGGFMLETRA